MSDLIADLVREFFKFFSGSLSLSAHVVEMLVEMSPGLFASFVYDLNPDQIVERRPVRDDDHRQPSANTFSLSR